MRSLDRRLMLTTTIGGAAALVIAPALTTQALAQAPAIEQLELAQRAADGDFYQQSSVDARLREMRQRAVELKRDGL